MLFIIIQPFKPELAHYSTINATFMLLLAVWCVNLAGYVIAKLMKLILFVVVGSLVTVSTFLYMSIIVMKWIYYQKKFGMDLIRRFSYWRNGYSPLS